VGRAADEVDQGRHTEQTAADAQEAGQHAGDVADQDGQPHRAGKARGVEVQHRGDIELVQGLIPGKALGAVLAGHAGLLLLHRLGVVVKDHPGDQGQEHHVRPAHDRADGAEAFQHHDDLGPAFNTDHRADQHDKAQFVIDVAELGVPHRRDHRLSGDMGNIGADGEGHGETEDVQARGNHPGAGHAEKAADDANRETEQNQARPQNFHARDGHV